MAEEDIAGLLGELVRIPSVNPDDDDGPEVSGEGRLARFLARRLEDLGFRVALEDQLPGRPNLIAGRGPDRPRRTLLVEGHLDTVSARGMTVPPFDGVVREGRLYGRGAADMKGAWAAALWALSAETLDRLDAAGCRTVVVGAIGEEKGNQGVRHLVRTGRVAADEALVLEPTELAVVHAHKGALWYRARVRGEPAHGSAPERGVNAIAGMARFMARLEEQIAADRARVSPLLGPPTLNIGRIQGGSGVNVVAGSCEIEVDRRTLPGEDGAALLDRARAALEDLRAAGAITGYELEPLCDGRPFETAADSPLVRRLAACCERAGAGARREGTAWFSDAGPLAGVCREVVVFGPGSIRQAHTRDEHIALDSLRLGGDILRDFFLTTAGETAAE